MLNWNVWDNRRWYALQSMDDADTKSKRQMLEQIKMHFNNSRPVLEANT